MTFTNKAAAQMKERVAKLLTGGEDGRRDGPHVSTFHSFCVSVLRRHINHLGYSRDFSIYDSDDQVRLIKSCIQDLGLGEQVGSPRSVSAESATQRTTASPRSRCTKRRRPIPWKRSPRSLTFTKRNCGKRMLSTSTICF